MSVTQSYPRPKATPTNSTSLALTLKVAELPDTPAAIGGSGTTGTLDCRLQCDADESGGTDVQDLFKLVATPDIDASGNATYTVIVTPIKGDGSAGTPQTLTVTHSETMDTWQTAAGRARQ